jgi:Fe-Mn family superoxide dismutase
MSDRDVRDGTPQAPRLKRRDFLTMAGIGAVGAGLLRDSPALGAPSAGREQQRGAMRMPHELPKLPYAYDALEPYYNEQTLRLHHDIHHAGYVKGLNAAEERVQALLKSGDFSGAKGVCGDLAFHGSGDILHTIFWTNMKPGGGGTPSGDLAKAMEKAFGAFDGFRGLFLAATNSVAGSGWGILAHRKEDDALVVLQAEKHENLTQWGVTPILVLDVWEHAYYLQYQNKRPEWTSTFMDHLVNWDDVAKRLSAARG